MKPEDIARYLVSHPDFFDKYDTLLSDLKIPHPHQDNVISLQERQTVALRNKNKILQEKLHELIRFGEENDAISEKMHRLTITLLTAYHFEDLLNGLRHSLCEDFSIPYFVMRLWELDFKNTDYEEFTPTSEDVHAIAASLTQPYCGNHIADGIKELFAEDADRLQSFSMLPLNTTRPVGLLVLASPEAQRFYASMGTLHLKRLGELISASIACHELTTMDQSPESLQHSLSDEPTT